MNRSFRDPKSALQWIVSELRKREIPFALVGGIAANAYGATRLLNDIDIDVPDDALTTLAIELNAHRSFGPQRSLSDVFDCALLGFTYAGQEIELSGAESMLIRDCKSGSWLNWPTDLQQVESRLVFDIAVPVIKLEPLIAYKELAGRETDLQDCEELRRKR